MNFRQTIVVALASLTTTGCVSKMEPKLRSQIVAIRQNGKAVEPYIWNQPIPDFASHFTTVMAPDIERSGCTNILIFIHGGLNHTRSSLERAERLGAEMRKQNIYPIFIHWRSSLTSSYFEHLFLLRQGQRAQFIGPVTSPFMLCYDVGASVLRAPMVWAQQLLLSDRTGLRFFGSQYSSDCPPKVSHWYERFWRRESVDIVNQQYCTLHNNPEGLQTSLGMYYSNKVDDLLVRIPSYWITLPAKLATEPFIDTLGRPAWDTMVRRTEAAMQPRTYFDERKQAGALYQFENELSKFTRANPKYQITLVGHSMGTLLLNDFVRRNDHDQFNLPITNIVYMAAACSILDFERAVVPHLQTDTGCKFYNLMLHPQNDAREMHWNALELCPRGSLLEWLDQFLAAPLSEEHYRLGKWDNVILATQMQTNDLPANSLFAPSIKPQVTLKAFSGGIQDSDTPQKHGDFSHCSFWEEAFWKVPDGTKR